MDMANVFVVYAVLCTGSVLAAVSIEDIADGGTVVETVGASPMFKCISPNSAVEWWVVSPLLGDLQLDSSSPYVITEATISGVTQSYLTIEGVEEQDSTTIECRSSSDPSDKVAFNLQVTDGSLPSDWIAPEIERRSDTLSSLEVEVDTELRLKCVGGAEGSNLVFTLNGIVITDDTENTLLTTSVVMNGNAQTLIMSRDPVVGGTYTCQDATYPDTQTDSIEVVVTEHPAVRVEIVSPSSPAGFVTGASFDVRCQAALGTDIVWSVDGRVLADGEDNFVIGESEDRIGQTVTSLLTKEDVELRDAGEYRCANAEDAMEYDSLVIEVYQPGSEPDSESDGDADSDDGDGNIFTDIFGGASGLLPSSLAIFVAAVLTMRMGRA